MLYDRKIKYVDYYENGERVKGGGFVKLEVRDGLLKMDIHIKGLYPTDSFVRDVVLRGSEAEEVLGRITLQEGVGCFGYSCEMTEGIGSTGISYEDLREIKIPVGGSRELCCVWEKTANRAAIPVNPLRREEMEQESSEPESAEAEASKSEDVADVSLITRSEGARLQETETQEIEAQEAEAQEVETQETEVQEIEAREAEAQEVETQETEVQERKARETKIPDAAPPETVPQQQMVPEPAVREIAAREAPTRETAAQETVIQTAELQQAEALDSESCETKNAASVPEHQEPTSKEINQHNEKPAVKLLEDKWQQLSSIYPHIRPFNDEREYLSLSPSDFVLFPESYYRAANNSFLLHGFYNYKHLILARVERRSEVRYYLGVPGNYYEREKQVAVMFGFESFECDREPAKTGDFGYYLMRMEL